MKIVKILSVALAVIMAVSVFAGCGEDKKGDTGMAITLKDDSNIEKVVTEKLFKKPKLKENQGTFTISPIFCSNMVLQANMVGRIWGNYWGYEDEPKVALEIKNDKTKKAKTFYGTADENGDFEIWFSQFDYGGPYTVTIYGEEGNSVSYENVLFGEVWVLGGQSNMGWAIGQCYGKTTNENIYQDIIDNSYNENVRSMLVWPVSASEPVVELSSCRAWAVASKESIPEWSACGYFFARRLNELYDIPVGVISACMGGTPISAWFPTGEWYKGVVNPIKRLRVRGVAWYQGEGDDNGYAERLEDLINIWREEFTNPDLFWAAVEMPRHISDDQWSRCRDEVRKLYGKVDKYTFAVTLDTGLYPEWTAEGDTLNGDGIHPYEKLKVGERLADAVAYDFYGAEGLWTCPYMESVTVEGEKITVKFTNVGEGLRLVGKNGFRVKFKGTNYTHIDPVLEGNDTIILDCTGMGEIKSLHYGVENYRGEGITSCADSVCVYSLKNGEIAYPAEQIRYDF